jgi:hypothetical protein
MFISLGGSDRMATMDDLKEMKYLECCIKVSVNSLDKGGNYPLEQGRKFTP